MLIVLFFEKQSLSEVKHVIKSESGGRVIDLNSFVLWGSLFNVTFISAMIQVHVSETLVTGCANPDKCNDSPAEVDKSDNPSASLTNKVLVDPIASSSNECKASVEMHKCSEVVEEGSDPPFVQVVKSFPSAPGEEAQEGGEAIDNEVTPNDHGPGGIEPPPVSLEDCFVGSVLVDLFLEAKEPV